MARSFFRFLMAIGTYLYKISDGKIGEEGFGRVLDPQIIRLHPVRIIAWGIDEKRQSRKVKGARIEVNTNQNHVIV